MFVRDIHLPYTSVHHTYTDRSCGGVPVTGRPPIRQGRSMHLHRLRTRSVSSFSVSGLDASSGPMSREQTLDIVASALRALPSAQMHDMQMTPIRNLRG